MECFAVQKVLDAAADGELDPSTQLRVDTHLEHCAHCTAQLGFVDMVKGATKEALKAQAPEALRARIVATLATENASEKNPKRNRRWIARAITSTALAAGIFGAVALRTRDELGGAALARLHPASAPATRQTLARRPEEAQLVGDTQLELDGHSVRHRHYRLGSASFSVLSSHEPIPVELADRGDVAGAPVQHETQDGTTVAAALHAPHFVVMSRDPTLAIEFAALNLLQRLSE